MPRRRPWVCPTCVPPASCVMTTVVCRDCGGLAEGLPHADLVRDELCNPCFHARAKAREEAERTKREHRREGGWKRA